MNLSRLGKSDLQLKNDEGEAADLPAQNEVECVEDYNNRIGVAAAKGLRTC